jgi:hypothetical protein
MSRFEKFFNAATVSGKKVLASTNPEMKAASTKDKFGINPVALKLMGLKPGIDRIMFFDDLDNATSLEDRFFICKGGVDDKGVEHGALIGKNGVFSYSGAWSAVQCQDMNVTEATADDMVARGIVEKSEDIIDPTTKKLVSKGSYIANQVVIGTVSIAKDTDDENNEVEARNVTVVADKDGNALMTRDLYLISNFRIKAHDPHKSEEEEVEDNEDGEQIDEATGEPVLTKSKKGKK